MQYDSIYVHIYLSIISTATTPLRGRWLLHHPRIHHHIGRGTATTTTAPSTSTAHASATTPSAATPNPTHHHHVLVLHRRRHLLTLRHLSLNLALPSIDVTAIHGIYACLCCLWSGEFNDSHATALAARSVFDEFDRNDLSVV